MSTAYYIWPIYLQLVCMTILQKFGENCVDFCFARNGCKPQQHHGIPTAVTSSLRALLLVSLLCLQRVALRCYRAPIFCRAFMFTPSALLSLGALAELGSTLGSNLSEYVAKVLPVLFRELRCDDPGNRRNAAYCAGVFCQHAPQQMQNQTGQLLQVKKSVSVVNCMLRSSFG